VTDTWGIAAVTQSLVALLRTITAEQSYGVVDIGSRAPDRIPAEDAPMDTRRLNLFLYQVTPNPGWANADLPYRGADGELSGEPTLAVDLHYILTAYGLKHDELDAQRMLGHAMALLHDNGSLTRDRIRAALNATPLAPSGLGDQIEMLRISQEVLGDEDLFRMWTTFAAPYRTSVGYQVSALLVRRTPPVVRGLPVRDWNLRALPLDPPIVESVEPRPLTAGGTATLRGLNFSADVVRVLFDGVEAAAPTVAAQEITAALPPLPAGVHTVVIEHEAAPDEEEPSDTRPFTTSDPFPFALAPTFTGMPGSVSRGQTITLNVAPDVGRSQAASLFIGRQGIDRQPLAAGDPAESATVKFKVPAQFPLTPAGREEIVRLRVDGVFSPLGVAADGTYTGRLSKVTA
jgi:hypothetical protein